MEVFELDISHLEKIVELRLKLWEFEKANADFNIRVPDIDSIHAEILSLFKNNKVQIFGLRKSSMLIGYIIGMIENASEYIEEYKLVGYIEGIFIEEGSRKMGGSTLLIDAVMTWFLSEDVHFIQLGVLTRNIGAIKTYKKYGFEEYYTKMKIII